jgi:hypothetical protein
MPRSDHGGISPRWMSSCGKDIADPSRTMRAGQRSAVDTGALVGAQYLGFVYGAGVFANGSSSGWSSHLASFTFSSVPSSCASIAAGTSTLICGGNYTNDDLSTSPDGFGNCDLALDHGAHDSANNGLFPKATV